MRKKEISKEEINFIRQLHKDGLNFNQIKVKTGYNHPVIERIIGEEKMEGRFDPAKSYIATCKKTGVVFTDYKNHNGTLSGYLATIYDEFELPTKKARKEYEYTNGKFWHEQYFDVSEKIDKPQDKVESNKIIEAYLRDKRTMGEIENTYNISQGKIYGILKDANCYVFINNPNKGNFTRKSMRDELINLKEKKWIEYNKREENPQIKQPIIIIEDNVSKKIIKIAKCKLTGKEFNDWKNTSGILTIHLYSIYPGIDDPTNYFKRRHKVETGSYWHEQYFDIVDRKIEVKETSKCKYCEWTTVDLDNSSGQYTLHLFNKHKKNISEYIEEFPEEKILFTTYLDKLQKQTTIESDNKNHVICQLCGKKISLINHSHLKLHNNMTIEEYIYLFPESETVSETTKEKLKNSYNLGLKLSPNTFSSKAQFEILDLLTINGEDCLLNDRKLLKGFEIDILCHPKKIGIEYNGIFYHTEIGGKKEKYAHLNKTLKSNDAGYNLIQIFEDEWVNKKEICIYKIKEIFGLKNNIVEINKDECLSREIDIDVKNNFMNKFHITGQDKSTICIGASYKDKLLSVMSIKTADGDGNYELTGFCTNTSFFISGIYLKLLDFFIKKYNPKKIISYADLRWIFNDTHNVYDNMGFKFQSIIEPDYTYFCSKKGRTKRWDKSEFTIEYLKEKYPIIYSDDKSEWDIMKIAGYDRIWDCGKILYSIAF